MIFWIWIVYIRVPSQVTREESEMIKHTSMTWINAIHFFILIFHPQWWEGTTLDVEKLHRSKMSKISFRPVTVLSNKNGSPKWFTIGLQYLKVNEVLRTELPWVLWAWVSSGQKIWKFCLKHTFHNLQSPTSSQPSRWQWWISAGQPPRISI